MTLRNKLIESLEILKKDVAMMADLALSNIREGLYAFKNNDQNLQKKSWQRIPKSIVMKKK